MNPRTSETLEKLRKITTLNHLQFMKTMIPSQKIILGIKAPQLKNILKELRLATRNLAAHEKIELAIEFIHTNIFEMGQIACEFVGKDKALMTAITITDLDKMNYKLDNWASVDVFSVYVFGKAWRMGKVSDEKLMQMVHHENFWQRRVAVVSTVPLNQKANGGTGDPKRTLMICKEVVGDYQDLIVKALSWALRELSKREPEIVREFIAEHEKVLHKRVLREVGNKLEFGLKNVK